MAAKRFVRADDLVRDSFVLARQIYDSGFRPDVLLVLWRGGTPVGMIVHEFLLYKGIETYHAAVKAESYAGIEQQQAVRIEHLDPLLPQIRPDSRVLIVNDIFDTGTTVRKILEALKTRTRNIRVATLYLRKGRDAANRTPDFFVRETEDWVVFPHELIGLSPEEIRTKDEYVHSLLQ